MRRSILIIAALLALSLSVTGCTGGTGPEPHPAVAAVTHLLELRRDDVRDADAYAPYFEDEGMAETLAAPGEVTTGTPRVPPFQTPYLSAETTSTADVAVVWEPDDAFEGWTPVTVFRTERVDGAWRVIDALEATVAPQPLSGEGE